MVDELILMEDKLSLRNMKQATADESQRCLLFELQTPMKLKA